MALPGTGVQVQSPVARHVERVGVGGVADPTARAEVAHHAALFIYEVDRSKRGAFLVGHLHPGLASVGRLEDLAAHIADPDGVTDYVDIVVV